MAFIGVRISWLMCAMELALGGAGGGELGGALLDPHLQGGVEVAVRTRCP
jgi:hypothetical protein